MSEVLITGSEGFVGQHLWKELERSDYTVRGTTLCAPETGLPNGVYECNILEKESLNNLVASLKPDVIFHLAAQAKTGLSFSQPQTTFEINTIGTINLLEAIRSIENYTPKILIVGTAEEYGPVPVTELPITEESNLNPQNPYAISKVANWFLARQYTKSFGFDIVYVTPFNHIFTGDLSARRDFSDVRDIVRAYRLLIEKAKAGERFVISSGHSIPVKDVVDTLLSLAKVRIEHRIDPKRNRPLDIADLYGSHDKLTQVTGWEPEIPLEKTLSDLLDWYRGQE